MRPTVAEIDLGALRGNFRLLEARVRAAAGEGAGLVGVVKADAYGHGLELCGPALKEAGAEWLGVTCVEEALVLRRALGGRKARVLVMSGVFAGEGEAVAREGLTPVVWEGWQVRELSPGAAVHVEVDTGMSRQGVGAGAPLASLLGDLRGHGVRVEGVMTHFSSPEMPGNGVMEEQMRRFEGAVAQMLLAGVRPEWVHAGNSANALRGEELGRLRGLAERAGARVLVRPGLGLYGIPTRFASGEALVEGLRAVMRWRTEVVGVREVPAGTSVGYNETFIAPEGGARLALLPVGYADGYRRELSGRGEVLVRGRRARVAGRVSMDQTVVDVSGVAGVAVGDEVVLLGSQLGGEIGAWEMAGWAGTIPYEVTCGVGGRVGRRNALRMNKLSK